MIMDTELDNDTGAMDIFLKEIAGIDIKKYHFRGNSRCSKCGKEVFITITVSGGADGD
jgi:hypothetical protein